MATRVAQQEPLTAASLLHRLQQEAQIIWPSLPSQLVKRLGLSSFAELHLNRTISSKKSAQTEISRLSMSYSQRIRSFSGQALSSSSTFSTRCSRTKRLVTFLRHILYTILVQITQMRSVIPMEEEVLSQFHTMKPADKYINRSNAP